MKNTDIFFRGATPPICPKALALANMAMHSVQGQTTFLFLLSASPIPVIIVGFALFCWAILVTEKEEQHYQPESLGPDIPNKLGSTN